MSFGKLYSLEKNPRTVSLQVVAKANNLDVELVPTDPFGSVSDDYRKLNRLGRIPTFEGKDGFVLTEAIAIAIYLTSQNEKTTLLGKTKQDYASILRWLSFANSELLPRLGGWFRPLVGRDPYNKKNVEDAKAATEKNLAVLGDHLLVNTYLVGERLTLADIFTASIITRGYDFFFDKEWRQEHATIQRWYETVRSQSIYHAVAGEPEYRDVAIPNTPPKKEKEEKPKAEPVKKQEKPKVQDDEEDEPPAAPKPKHPLEALPKPTLVLDDWKRKYSNADTRTEALPWFWENAKFDEYSLWRVDYKFPEDLTLVFMSSNLIGGFFARLEASRKYIFGAASVYGVANDSIIQGAFLVRGQDAVPALDVAPDWESYELVKLDPTKPEDREFVDAQWAWDKPTEAKGKTYEWADGKVFK